MVRDSIKFTEIGNDDHTSNKGYVSGKRLSGLNIKARGTFWVRKIRDHRVLNVVESQLQ